MRMLSRRSILLGMGALPVLGAPGAAPGTNHLLLDSRTVERTEGVRLALGTVTKTPHNPLFRNDAENWRRLVAFALRICSRGASPARLGLPPFATTAPAFSCPSAITSAPFRALCSCPRERQLPAYVASNPNISKVPLSLRPNRRRN